MRKRRDAGGARLHAVDGSAARWRILAYFAVQGNGGSGAAATVRFPARWVVDLANAASPESKRKD